MNGEVKALLITILSHISFLIFILWAFIPDWILHNFGFYYYPSKHWSCVVPTFLLFSVPSLLIFITCDNRSLLPPLDSYYSFTDDYTKFIEKDTSFDIPLDIANKKMYEY